MTAALLLTLPSPDWHQMFTPSVSPLELVIRGTIMYLVILAAMRIFRRQTGSLNTADLLVVVLVADEEGSGRGAVGRAAAEGGGDPGLTRRVGRPGPARKRPLL